MRRASEHAPGETAPVTGLYQELSVLGTPTQTIVRVERGQSLPYAPIGFAWHLKREIPDEDG